MKKDIEWLRDEILLEIECLEQSLVEGKETPKEYYFNNGKYIALVNVLKLINQLDEPKDEQIMELESFNDKLVKENNQLRNALNNQEVLSQDLPVIPKHVADYLEFAKKETSLMQIMETASVISEWSTMGSVFDWISPNDETFARAWLYGYKVEEEPLYHALVKGHELLADHDALSFTYWNFNMSNGYLLHGNKFSKQVRFLTKMTKEDWNKLGINDSNADFVRVEEAE